METRKILVADAKLGMQVANDVYDELGRLIVPYGTILEQSIIDKIEHYSIFAIKVVVEDELNELVKNSRVEETESTDDSYYDKLRKESSFAEFEKTFNESVTDLKKSLNDIVAKNAPVEVDRMLQGAKTVIESNKTTGSMFDVLNCMRGYDDLTYVHSMNVALICNVMAGWLKLSEKESDMFTLAGLLHDIGKVRIPYEIIAKPGKLTEQEYKTVKQHPQFGYEILKSQDIDERIKQAAYSHHERYNGNGYPNGLVGHNIPKFGRMLAIADVYDAMTANRVYREGLCPYDVIEHFEKDMDVYDPQYLLVFLEKIAETYVSSNVLLTDGREGKILMINRTDLSRPVVMTDKEVVDLSKNRKIKIAKLL